MVGRDEQLQHHGVKGMKWGVHRTKLRATLASAKREREWRQVVNNFDKMNTKDVQRITKRIQLENDFKKLAKTRGIGTAKSKRDYLLRENMSDQELTRKINRLKAKSSLVKSAKDATETQRELGMKVAKIGAQLGAKYIVNKRIGTKDIVGAVINANKNNPKAKATKSTVDGLLSKKEQEDVLKELRAEWQKRRNKP